MNKRIYNFSAGPAMLPLSVLEEAQRNLVDTDGQGMSILEMSHRSAYVMEMMTEAEENLRKLLHIPDTYHVLFLQGGANLQFSMVPLNLAGDVSDPTTYIVTGSWGIKAMEEAKRASTTRVAWDGRAGNYKHVPSQDELNLPGSSAYVHFTSNETIQGVQFATEPDVGDVPLICDMSSDFMSRPVDIMRYGLIYAGAQKNAGPAGVTLVIVRNDLLSRIPDNLHTMLDYRTHIKKKSAYNTPPVYPIYMVMLVTRWLLNDIGGLEQMAQLNEEKANLLYQTIDQSGGYYRGHAQPDSRSKMNVAFRLPTPELEAQFIKEAAENNLRTLKGHRSVGGLRASIYNAMPLEGVQALTEFMLNFQKANPA